MKDTYKDTDFYSELERIAKENGGDRELIRA